MLCSLLARTCVARASTRLSCNITTLHVIQRHIIRTCISLITTMIVISNMLHVWMVPMINGWYGWICLHTGMIWVRVFTACIKLRSDSKYRTIISIKLRTECMYRTMPQINVGRTRGYFTKDGSIRTVGWVRPLQHHTHDRLSTTCYRSTVGPHTLLTLWPRVQNV